MAHSHPPSSSFVGGTVAQAFTAKLGGGWAGAWALAKPTGASACGPGAHQLFKTQEPCGG